MSISAVAKEASVSKSTVSRVINNAPGVRPEVALEVRRSMERIGYQPPARRRGPKPESRRGIRTGSLLMLLLGYDTAQIYRMPILPTLLHGVESAVRHAGLNLILASSEPNGVVPAALAVGRIDGVLVMNREATVSPAINTRLSSMPVVWLLRNRAAMDGVADWVHYNNPSVGILAANHLISHGHRRLAFMNFEPRHEAFIQRQRSFADRANYDGIQVTEFIASKFSGILPARETVVELVDQFLATAHRPTGLFVPTVTALPALYRELHARGVRFGKELEIVSCDYDAQILPELVPTPAIIDIHMDLVARRGVEQLLWRVANPAVPCPITVMVEPSLILPGVLPAALL